MNHGGFHKRELIKPKKNSYKHIITKRSVPFLERTVALNLSL